MTSSVLSGYPSTYSGMQESFKDVKLKERDQCTFTRQLFLRARLHMISYAERCTYLNIDLLKLRRLHADLIITRKIINRFCFYITK